LFRRERPIEPPNSYWEEEYVEDPAERVDVEYDRYRERVLDEEFTNEKNNCK
jgi:hypothetical protein